MPSYGAEVCVLFEGEPYQDMWETIVLLGSEPLDLCEGGGGKVQQIVLTINNKLTCIHSLIMLKSHCAESTAKNERM